MGITKKQRLFGWNFNTKYVRKWDLGKIWAGKWDLDKVWAGKRDLSFPWEISLYTGRPVESFLSYFERRVNHTFEWENLCSIINLQRIPKEGMKNKEQKESV